MFSRRSDRDDPLVYVGRDDLFDIVDDHLTNTQRAQKTLSNGVFLKGAPGAGKSAFLSQIEKKYANQNDIRVVIVEGESLSNHVRFVSAFYSEAVSRKLKRDSTNFTIGTSGVNFGADWKDIRQYVHSELNQGCSVWEAIHVLLGEEAKHSTFIVCIDEAQRIKADQGQNTNAVGVQIHGGKTEGIRLMPVFAGLNDTPARLNKAGISREAKSYEALLRLSHEESKTYVKAFFNEASLNMRGKFHENDIENIAETIAVASEGWPRHLHCYQDALAHTLYESVCSERNAIGLDAIIHRGNEARIAYAESRLDSAELTEFESVLFEVSKRANKNELSFRDLKEMSFAEGLTREEFQGVLRSAVHCGVIQQCGSHEGVNLYEFPIPSFFTVMRNMKDKERTLADMNRELQDNLESMSADKESRGF